MKTQNEENCRKTYKTHLEAVQAKATLERQGCDVSSPIRIPEDYYWLMIYPIGSLS